MSIHEEIPLKRAMMELKLWLDRHNLPHDSLTVILNFADANEAFGFDVTVKRTAPPYLMVRDIRRIKLAGIRLKVESPLHEP